MTVTFEARDPSTTSLPLETLVPPVTVKFSVGTMYSVPVPVKLTWPEPE